jgi:hypothetical protein
MEFYLQNFYNTAFLSTILIIETPTHILFEYTSN